ncbi:MAG: glutamine-hydrolyzing carbamoyl-phosphate synthase small subunit [Magnetococcales bacterium]|nr:glutamine-hydrolyzing carbamoyl-phosphate synthase small subunit [Magnetococcales bacterium]
MRKARVGGLTGLGSGSVDGSWVAQKRVAILVLEDGTVFKGHALGAASRQVGEVCFNTSMTGYQEIMSDPSYAGQIVTMTATQIGNVGINPEDMESARPHIRGFVIKESSRIVSNWRQRETLGSFLERHAIPAIEGIDTRQLVNLLRSKGSQRGALSTIGGDPEELLAQARAWPGLEGMDLTGEVTCSAPHVWQEGGWRLGQGYASGVADAAHHVVVMDFGVKYNILRCLVESGCRLTVVPATAQPSDILALAPDGVFLSNGPGDPDAVKGGIAAIRALLTSGKPLFGICLGHQMLSLALGARTAKMKFGHRGGNHPVQNLATGQVEVTAQNHGFMVEDGSLPKEAEVTHRSLFDGTVEGIRLRDRPVFSVQFHPEASPGPHDSRYLFQQFADMMRG